MSTDGGEWPQPPVVFGESGGSGDGRAGDGPQGEASSADPPPRRFPLFVPPGVELSREEGREAAGGEVPGDWAAVEMPPLEGVGEVVAEEAAPVAAPSGSEAPAEWEWDDGEADPPEPPAEDGETGEAVEASWEFVSPAEEAPLVPGEDALEAEAIPEPEVVPEPPHLEAFEEVTPMAAEAVAPVEAEEASAEGVAPLPGPSEEVAVLLEDLAEELRRTGDIPFDPDGRESSRLEGLLRGMLAGYLAHLRGGDG